MTFSPLVEGIHLVRVRVFAWGRTHMTSAAALTGEDLIQISNKLREIRTKEGDVQILKNADVIEEWPP